MASLISPETASTTIESLEKAIGFLGYGQAGHSGKGGIFISGSCIFNSSPSRYGSKWSWQCGSKL
ncbi:hypothetical protein [Wolbachia endosymbiont of Trichogramma kaykai]|uniref:hypothetical protein n=1 Tax=Wolbachia endosymbiont of Trichogramma kaykai TaxID=444066 RepID=UPI003891AE7B